MSKNKIKLAIAQLCALYMIAPLMTHHESPCGHFPNAISRPSASFTLFSRVQSSVS